MGRMSPQGTGKLSLLDDTPSLNNQQIFDGRARFNIIVDCLLVICH
jgi:hypothetical protein